MSSTLLTAVALLFPFWMQIWEQRPLTEEDTKDKNTLYVEESIYPILSRSLETGDAVLRGKIYVILASEEIPANRDFLLNTCLSKEKSAEMQASILKLLGNKFASSISAEEIAPYLKSKENSVLLQAIKLYAQLQDAKPSLLLPMLAAPEYTPEDNIVLQQTLWEVFASSPKFANAIGNKVLDYKNVPIESIRNLALQAAMAQTTRLSEAKVWMEEALQSNDQTKFVLAQDKTPHNRKILSALMKDKNPALRQAACSSEGMAKKYPDMLAAALNDKSSGVRNAALQSMLNLPALQPNDYPAILKLFNDNSLEVRTSAEDVFVKHASQERDVIDSLEPYFANNAPHDARLAALNAARKLNATQFASKIAEQLNANDAPEIVAASLNALAFLAQPGEYQDIILPYAKHSSQLVRQMAVRAMGRLQLKDAVASIKELSADPNTPNVRTEAFEAMGRAPQMEYLPLLVTCLTQTKKTTTYERSKACWAIAQIKPQNNTDIPKLYPAVNRMKTQCTKPVIPDIMPMFDDVTVIGNAFLSLAVLAKTTGDEKIISAFNEVVNMYDIPPEQSINMANWNSNTTPPPLGPLTYSIIHQAKQFYDGTEITTQPHTTSKLMLPVQKL